MHRATYKLTRLPLVVVYARIDGALSPSRQCRPQTRTALPSGELQSQQPTVYLEQPCLHEARGGHGAELARSSDQDRILDDQDFDPGRGRFHRRVLGDYPLCTV